MFAWGSPAMAVTWWMPRICCGMVDTPSSKTRSRPGRMNERALLPGEMNFAHFPAVLEAPLAVEPVIEAPLAGPQERDDQGRRQEHKVELDPFAPSPLVRPVEEEARREVD